MRRVIVAFAVTALIYPLIALLGGGQHAVGGFIAVAGFTVPAVILIGLPAFLLFRRKLWFSWWQFTVSGAAIGLFFSVLFLGIGLGLYTALPLSIIGAVHGLLFWFLAIWKNREII